MSSGKSKGRFIIEEKFPAAYFKQKQIVSEEALSGIGAYFESKEHPHSTVHVTDVLSWFFGLGETRVPKTAVIVKKKSVKDMVKGFGKLVMTPFEMGNVDHHVVLFDKSSHTPCTKRVKPEFLDEITAESSMSRTVKDAEEAVLHMEVGEYIESGDHSNFLQWNRSLPAPWPSVMRDRVYMRRWVVKYVVSHILDTTKGHESMFAIANGSCITGADGRKIMEGKRIIFDGHCMTYNEIEALNGFRPTIVHGAEMQMKVFGSIDPVVQKTVMESWPLCVEFVGSNKRIITLAHEWRNELGESDYTAFYYANKFIACGVKAVRINSMDVDLIYNAALNSARLRELKEEYDRYQSTVNIKRRPDDKKIDSLSALDAEFVSLLAEMHEYADDDPKNTAKIFEEYIKEEKDDPKRSGKGINDHHVVYNRLRDLSKDFKKREKFISMSKILKRSHNPIKSKSNNNNNNNNNNNKEEGFSLGKIYLSNTFPSVEEPKKKDTKNTKALRENMENISRANSNSSSSSSSFVDDIFEGGDMDDIFDKDFDTADGATDDKGWAKSVDEEDENMPDVFKNKNQQNKAGRRDKKRDGMIEDFNQGLILLLDSHVLSELIEDFIKDNTGERKITPVEAVMCYITIMSIGGSDYTCGVPGISHQKLVEAFLRCCTDELDVSKLFSSGKSVTYARKKKNRNREEANDDLEWGLPMNYKWEDCGMIGPDAMHNLIKCAYHFSITEVKYHAQNEFWTRLGYDDITEALLKRRKNNIAAHPMSLEELTMNMLNVQYAMRMMLQTGVSKLTLPHNKNLVHYGYGTRMDYSTGEVSEGDIKSGNIRRVCMDRHYTNTLQTKIKTHSKRELARKIEATMDEEIKLKMEFEYEREFGKSSLRYLQNKDKKKEGVVGKKRSKNAMDQKEEEEDEKDMTREKDMDDDDDDDFEEEKQNNKKVASKNHKRFTKKSKLDNNDSDIEEEKQKKKKSINHKKQEMPKKTTTTKTKDKTTPKEKEQQWIQKKRSFDMFN